MQKSQDQVNIVEVYYVKVGVPPSNRLLDISLFERGCSIRLLDVSLFERGDSHKLLEFRYSEACLKRPLEKQTKQSTLRQEVA